MGIRRTRLSFYCFGEEAIIVQGYHFQQDVVYALNTPFNPSFNKPFDTISSFLASNSSMSQFTDAYLPFKYFARSVVKYTAKAPASSAVQMQHLIFSNPYKEKKRTRIQCKRPDLGQVVQNWRQHCSRVIHHRPNVRVFQRYKLIEPIQREFGEHVATASWV